MPCGCHCLYNLWCTSICNVWKFNFVELAVLSLTSSSISTQMTNKYTLICYTNPTLGNNVSVVKTKSSNIALLIFRRCCCIRKRPSNMTTTNKIYNHSHPSLITVFKKRSLAKKEADVHRVVTDKIQTSTSRRARWLLIFDWKWLRCDLFLLSSTWAELFVVNDKGQPL